MKVKYQHNNDPASFIDFAAPNILSPADNNIGNDSPQSILELDFKLSFNRIYFIGAVQEMTSKNLMDWKEQGLLPEFSVAEEQKWTRFNLLEVLWLLTIKELKKFGVSNANIKEVKNELIFSEGRYKTAKKQFGINNIKKDPASQNYTNEDAAYLSESLSYHSAMSEFNNVVTEIFVSRINSRIIVFSNGESYYYRGSMDNLEKRLSEEDYGEVENPTCSIEKMEKESHISISLTNLIINHLLIDNQNFKQVAKLILTTAEIDFLNELKKDNVSEVKVKLKNKKIEMIEVTEKLKLQVEARICELMLTGGYQDFQIKTNKGSVILFQRTTKYLK